MKQATRSTNLKHMDELWRAYVNSDPELAALEREKRLIAHTRSIKAHYKQARKNFIPNLLRNMVQLAQIAVVSALYVAVMMGLFALVL